MKVMLINGSPHPKGCTYTALCEVAKGLEEYGIEPVHFFAGSTTKGCLGCGYCAKAGECVTKDCVNDAIAMLDEMDGFVFGSPVHYASASGEITSFLDRLFYAGGAKLQFKPGAVVASCRRGGSTPTLDQLSKYCTISNMPLVSSQYWTMVHGNAPEETVRDEEGMQTMRVLGRNMAWLLRSIEAGKQAGITLPAREERLKTNFIR